MSSIPVPPKHRRSSFMKDGPTFRANRSAESTRGNEWPLHSTTYLSSYAESRREPALPDPIRKIVPAPLVPVLEAWNVAGGRATITSLDLDALDMQDLDAGYPPDVTPSRFSRASSVSGSPARSAIASSGSFTSSQPSSKHWEIDPKDNIYLLTDGKPKRLFTDFHPTSFEKSNFGEIWESPALAPEDIFPSPPVRSSADATPSTLASTGQSFSSIPEADESFTLGPPGSFASSATTNSENQSVGSPPSLSGLKITNGPSKQPQPPHGTVFVQERWDAFVAEYEAVLKRFRSIEVVAFKHSRRDVEMKIHELELDGELKMSAKDRAAYEAWWKSMQECQNEFQLRAARRKGPNIYEVRQVRTVYGLPN